MGFGEAIKNVFSNYATFSGRARRSEFWWFYLFTFLVQLPFTILFYVLFFAAYAPLVDQIGPDGTVPDSAIDDINWGLIILGGALLTIVSLFLFVPTLAVWARRLHDMGQTGHWLWLMVISLAIVPFIMAFLDSERGTNRWGEDPKAAQRPGAAPGSFGSQAGSAYPAPGQMPPGYAPPAPAQQPGQIPEQRQGQQPPSTPPQ